MLNPKDEYKLLSNIDNIKDISYYTVFEKYIVQNLKGEKKLIEIDSTDQESIMMSANGGFPYPGFTYTFIYKGADIKIGPEQFSDFVPIVFCMNNGDGNYFSGINLNMLPPSARLNFLDAYYKTFKDFYDKEVDILAQNNKLALNKRFINYAKAGKGQEMLNIFNKYSKENFKFGYRKYLFKNIKNFRMIEYEELKYIPFYEPKNAFRKLSYDQIHKLYKRTL